MSELSKATIRITNNDVQLPNPLRVEFEEHFEKNIRPGQVKWVKDALAEVDDGSARETQDLWEDYIDGEFKDTAWDEYRDAADLKLPAVERVKAAILRDNERLGDIAAQSIASHQEIEQLSADNQALLRDISRSDYEVRDAALEIVKKCGDDLLAIRVYFLAHKGLSQRKIAEKLNCSVGTVNDRLYKLTKLLNVRIPMMNVRHTADVPNVHDRRELIKKRRK